MSDAYSPSTCRKVISAFHYQRPLIEKKMEERLAASKKIITNKIPEKGTVALFDNSDDVRYRPARQAYQKYRSIPSGPAELAEGTMPARDCNGRVTLQPALVDPSVINACNGVAEWTFAHGWATRTSEDMKFAYKSPIICIEDWARQGPDMTAKFFSMLRDEFVKYGPDNFEANLREKVIELGESNASITGSSNHFTVTTGGWEAPPEHLLSIPFLEKYRRYMLGVEDSDIKTPADVLEIVVPFDDFMNAVHQDILRTSGPQISLEAKYYEDPLSPYYGKAFFEYKRIRAIFDDNPMRGYLEPQGSGYRFVEIMPWRNVRGETIQGAADGAGIVWEDNPDYWKSHIVCNGVQYQVIAIAWALSSRAFERYRVSETVAPAGVNPVGTNFNVEIRSGPWIPCNDLGNQFFMISQHKARLKTLLPKLAGAIIYIPTPVQIGYHLDPCYDESPDTVTAAAVEMDNLEPVRPDLCEQQNCETCLPGTVANAAGACVADGDGTLEMIPCGTVEAVWISGTLNLVVKVYRRGNLKDSAGVSYATADVTALAATHYTNTSGSLSWEADEGGYKTITVPIIGADASVEKQFTLTLSSATGGASLGDCAILTVQIQPTGA